MVELREYQQRIVDGVWEDLFTKNKILVVAPPGAGKTECFIALCERALRSKPDIKILILLNKVLLVEQTKRRISKVIKDVGVYCASLNKKEFNSITVASVQTINKVDVEKINLVIIDEAHNFNEDLKSVYGSFINRINHDKLKVIGFTATPYRASGFLFGEKKFFEKIDHVITFEELINNGYLVTPRLKSSKEEFNTRGLKIVNGDFDLKQITELTEDEQKASVQVKDALSKLHGRNSVAWACATIRHAEIIAGYISGARLIHSKMSQEEQESSMRSFKSGASRHIVFVSMLSEGIDIPKIDALVFLRPTRSIVRYIQTVGRVLRPFDGKTDALILDYGQVVKNCGPITAPFVRKAHERRKDPDDLMKVCDGCFEIIEKKESVCPDCGFEFVKKPKKLEPKLTERPESNINILGKMQINEMECGSVSIRKHVSKAGNDCLVIDYKEPFKTDEFFSLSTESISEYFQWNNDWAQRKLIKRLNELSIEYYADLSTQAQSKVNKIPKKVVYSFDGKYKKVLNLIF